ncbi:hypothetical protein L218DRAFT_955595 [Marasmius fiardii PR-910]|nr:hypothetical protein L218DRAFT_955595 [Marasmius fiardii PR-910]
MVNNFPVYAPQSVYVLLLIENSGGVFNVWPDLRDRYLGPLLQKIELDDPSIPVTTFVLESLPPNPTQHRKPIVPRQYRTSHDGLQDVRFNHSASNRLTYPKIQEAAKYIVSTATNGSDVQRHIVIAAASPPVEERPSESRSGSRTSSWYRLAQYLAEADVRCHLLLKSGPGWEGLTNLFEEMLRLQEITEERPWFPIDMQKITVRLSSQRKASKKDNNAQELGPSEPKQLPPTPANKKTAADPFPSYPISPTAISTASGSSTPASPPQSPQDSVPSLVSQLQQVHGLTKKKVYGTKPTRRPFVSGEVYHGDPVNRKSLSISPESSPMMTNHGGKTPSPSTFDRSSRRYMGSSTDSRPYPRSRGSYDAATPSYTSPQIYDPSWLRRDSGSSVASGGSVSLSGSPPPQADASPVAVTPNSSHDYPSVSSKRPPPSAPLSPHQQSPPSLTGSHIQPEGVAHMPHHYTPQAMVGPTRTSTTLGGEETSETETDLSNKNPGTMGWDPNIYRNELLSHLAGPTTTSHYVPSMLPTYGTPSHEMMATFNTKGRLHTADDLERPDGTGSHPTLYPYESEDWQSGEQQFNSHTHYSPSSASYPSKNSKLPPGNNSLTNWAG